MEDADDPGGPRLPDVEIEEPEEIEEDDPHVPGRQERLKAEASSVLHKLTHLPKNPFCDSCQRGKMKEKYPRRGAFKRNLEKWCELVTFDHLYSGSSWFGISTQALCMRTRSWIKQQDMLC